MKGVNCQNGKIVNRKRKISCIIRDSGSLTEDEMKDTFDEFWSLGDVTRQHNYILGSTERSETKHKTTNTESRKSNTFEYYIGKKRICKDTYLRELPISN